jgi:hypothetical protein
MRWIRGLPLTAIALDNDNNGRCGGTGRLVRADDVLLVMLAGYAAESDCGSADVDLSGACNDFECARRILSAERWLRGGSQGIDEALVYYFRLACELLQSHRGLIHELAAMLAAHGYVSAYNVRAICSRASPRTVFDRRAAS